MADFDDRRDAYENKFALDASLMFKAEARTCKIVGLWAADQMDMEGDAANLYAKEVVSANLQEPGFDDIKRKLIADFRDADVEVSEHSIDRKIEESFARAQQEIHSEEG